MFRKALVVLTAIFGLVLISAPPAQAAEDPHIMATCQTRGYPVYYQVRCNAYNIAEYYAWIDCSGLSSNRVPYRKLSRLERSKPFYGWGPWTQYLWCDDGYYMTNAWYYQA